MTQYLLPFMFTPGPWVQSGAWVRQPNMDLIAHVTADENREPPRSWEEVVANARLIAAAPDLLTQLVSLLDQIRTIGIPDWHGAEGLDLSLADTAVARAINPQ